MFYAFVHRYGPEMRDSEGERIGHVEWFDSKHMRDVFVDSDHNNEAISSKVARWHLVNELICEYPGLYDDAKYMTAHEIIDGVRMVRTVNGGW